MVQSYFTQVGPTNGTGRLAPSQEEIAQFAGALLDTSRPREIVGAGAQALANRIRPILHGTRFPLYFVGDSGTGKTHIAEALAVEYARATGTFAASVQLTPEMTKTTLIMGFGLKNGSLVVRKGILAFLAKYGGCAVLDEATHPEGELLLMINTMMDRNGRTSVGDEMVEVHPNFRVIFCSNTTKYAGNKALPQSFAQRVLTFPFPYLTPEDEAEIAMHVAKDESLTPIDVPEAVVRYVTSIIRTVREGTYPLSVRNIAGAIVLLNHLPRDQAQSERFGDGTSAEAIRRKVYKQVTGTDARTSRDLTNPEVEAVLDFISHVGPDQFKDTIRQATMYHLPVDGAQIFGSNSQERIDANLF
jgi:hypothetical protein